jgi:hypothetical protein
MNIIPPKIISMSIIPDFSTVKIDSKLIISLFIRGFSIAEKRQQLVLIKL